MNAERGASPFETALDRTPANYTPLTPLTFIERAAAVWPDHPSVVDGARRFTWAGTYARCRRLASALAQRGIGAGDCVAVFAPNVPAIYEASFGVPMLGAVLNTINVRLDPAAIAFILEHGEAKALLTDRELSPVVADALAPDGAPAAGHRRRRRPRGGRGAHRRDRVRGVPRRGRPRIRMVGSRRRMARDLAQLHLGHHREPEGRRLPPPRRVPQRALERRRLEPRASSRLPVDPADVPLQRVVLPVDAGGGRRDQRLRAQGGGRRDLRGDRLRGGDASLRCAGGARDDPERGRGGAAPASPSGARDDRRRAPRPPRCWNAWSRKGSR